MKIDFTMLWFCFNRGLSDLLIELILQKEKELIFFPEEFFAVHDNHL